MSLNGADIGPNVFISLFELRAIHSILIFKTPVGLFDVKIPTPDWEIGRHKVLVQSLLEILIHRKGETIPGNSCIPIPLKMAIAKIELEILFWKEGHGERSSSARLTEIVVIGEEEVVLTVEKVFIFFYYCFCDRNFFSGKPRESECIS